MASTCMAFKEEYGYIKNKANLRKGPSLDYPIIGEFSKKNMPVKIRAEKSFNKQVWMEIEDSKGVVGWTKANLINNRQRKHFAIIKAEKVQVCRMPLGYEKCDSIATLQSNFIIEIIFCSQQYCRIVIESKTGWVNKNEIWGV